MIRLLSNADRELVLNYTVQNSIETTFLFGNVINFGLENDKSLRRCGDYFGYFENDLLKGILAIYNLGSCIPHYVSGGAIREFAEIMKDRQFSVLLGMKKLIEPLYDLIKENKITTEYDESSYYVNKNFKPYIIDNAEFIDAVSTDDSLINFALHAYNIGLGQSRTYEDVKASFLQKPRDEEFIFLKINGKVAAQACVQTATDEINQIGGVYTLEEERGKGYCKAVVSELCRRIIEKGKLPSLMVRKNNTPAVKAYQALGFENYTDYLLIHLKE